MGRKLFIVFFLFLFQIGFSQTGKLLHGKVVNNETPINGIEVININTKSTTITDRNGRFAIAGNPKDVLVFVSKNYEPKKVLVEQSNISNADFTIALTQKKEQLEEVVITSQTNSKFDSQKIVDGKYFDDAQSSPKNRFIYDGTIENGTDFVRIYKDIVKAFRKDKEGANNTAMPFKTYVLTNYDVAFFAKTLDIKQNEIIPFLEFCETDAKSKMITESDNTLSVMDFLIVKNMEFKKSSVTKTQ